MSRIRIVHCPTCGARLKLLNQRYGATITCPKCNAAFPLDEGSGESAPHGECDDAKPFEGLTKVIFLLGKAAKMAQENNHHEAIGYFDEALALNSDVPAAWNDKGMSLKALGRLNDALDCFNRALEINSADPDYWNNKGMVLGMMEKHEQALDCFKRAIELDPSYEKAWYNMAVSLEAKGEYARALDCVERALSLKGDYAIALFFKGVILANFFGRYREALECLVAADRLGYPPARTAAAICRQKLRQG